MVTIVAGTNRHGSNTLKVAREYKRLLAAKGIEAILFSLEGVDVLHRTAAFEKIEEEIIIPTTHFIFIVPEYNGSFPGVVKMLIDTSRSHDIWFYKKALLTGDSTGRAGNLRGLDHLADILNFMKITVHPNKLPISAINKMLDEQGNIADAGTLKAINQQLDEFIMWM
jgi:NAD(P)H-dependent FMN reductase